MPPPARLTIQCDIVGHASPRWKGAKTDDQRVKNNDVLSQKRAEAFMKEFKPALEKELGKYQLKFYENVSYEEDTQPDQSATIGAQGRGQRDSLPLAGGDKKNDAAIYRRSDIVVRVARSIQDQMPVKVTQTYKRSTKSKFWYASVGVSGSITAVAGYEFFRVKLRNDKGDEAEGSVAAISGGVGAKYSLSPYSWTEEASFMTNRQVGFEDFHGVHVRYTTAGLILGVGYTRAYLTFYGMGPDAASLHVGGWGTGFQVSMDLGTGILFLDMVPSNYAIERYDTTEWQDVRSDWITQQKLSVFFDTGESKLSSTGVSEIKTFAKKVATDIRTK
jgi:hypothetical protein